MKNIDVLKTNKNFSGWKKSELEIPPVEVHITSHVVSAKCDEYKHPVTAYYNHSSKEWCLYPELRSVTNLSVREWKYID